MILGLFVLVVVLVLVLVLEQPSADPALRRPYYQSSAQRGTEPIGPPIEE